MSLCVSFVLSVHLVSIGRISFLQGHVTDFSVQESLIIAGAGLAVKAELLSAACRVEAEQVPVTGGHCEFLLVLNLAHALLDTMVDARCVCDDERRSGICLGLSNRLDALVPVSAHGDLCDIYVAIAHSHSSEVFLLGLFTACCELGNCADRSSLGGLTACVGVNLSVEAEYVDVLAGSEDVVDTAVR